MNSVQVRAGGVSIEVSQRTIVVAIDGPGAPKVNGHEAPWPEPAPGQVVAAADLRRFIQEPVEGTVLDRARGLMWSQDDVGERVDFEDAEKACRELRLGGFDDWRLPTIQELLTLVDYTRTEPAIDTNKFPNCQSGYYWTSTPLASSPDYAWIVYFYNGNANYDHRDNDAFVRAVRGVPASQ